MDRWYYSIIITKTTGWFQDWLKFDTACLLAKLEARSVYNQWSRASKIQVHLSGAVGLPYFAPRNTVFRVIWSFNSNSLPFVALASIPPAYVHGYWWKGSPHEWVGGMQAGGKHGHFHPVFFSMHFMTCSQRSLTVKGWIPPNTTWIQAATANGQMSFSSRHFCEDPQRR